MNTGKFVSDREIANLIRNPHQSMCDYGAWHWLLSQAAFKDHDLNYKGKPIKIMRGQVPTTYRSLAQEFRWSVNRVRNFIKNLKKFGRVDTTIDTGFLMITICGYDEIQSFRKPTDTRADTDTSTKADTSSDTNRTKLTKKTNKSGGSAPRAEAHATPPLEPWKRALKDRVGEAVYISWIAPLQLEGGYVICPTELSLQRCSEKYKQHIECALGGHFKGFKLKF